MTAVEPEMLQARTRRIHRVAVLAGAGAIVIAVAITSFAAGETRRRGEPAPRARIARTTTARRTTHATPTITEASSTASTAPTTATAGTRVSYTATLTNPTGQWVFDPYTAGGLSIYLYTAATEPGDMIPYIVDGPLATAPEFRHQTPTGLKMGLLFGPHASYRFTGRVFAPNWDFETADFVVSADIIGTPPGVADAAGTIVRAAGALDVLVPPTSTTSTAPAPTTGS